VRGPYRLRQMTVATKQFFVNAAWDDEAKVWYIAETDIPGLVAEAPTLDELRNKVVALAPEMLIENAHFLPEGEDHDDGDLVRLCVESSFSIERARAY
jgi:hypothetical protein